MHSTEIQTFWKESTQNMLSFPTCLASFNFLLVFPLCLGISSYKVKATLFSLLAKWLHIIIQFSKDVFFHSLALKY